MKRFSYLLTLAVMLFAALFAFTSCGHEHSYEEEWSSDLIYHWKAADCRHKEEKAFFAPHTLDGNAEEGYTCRVCSKVITAEELMANPLSVSLARSYAPTGATIRVEGYYVGVSDGAGKEILLKDTETDALIALRDIPTAYGTWPDLKYQRGDLLSVYVNVVDEYYNENVAKSKNKRYLSFSQDKNTSLYETLVSRGNDVSYTPESPVLIENQEDLEKLFQMESIENYTYVRIKGRLFLNAYLGSDKVLLYRPHMNAGASVVADIKPDGVRAIGLRKNVLQANIGDAWENYFSEEWTTESISASIGYFQEVDITAVFVDSSAYNYFLNVLDSTWLRPVDETIKIQNNQDVLIEMANAYLRKRGLLEYDQFGSRRMVNATPEEATAQDYVFLDCSSYVTSVYYNTFGISAIPSSFGSQKTKNYAAYARQNAGKSDYPDVIGYWEALDYASESEQRKVLAELYEMLQPGDILVYRRGSASYGASYNESNLSGHAILYMGDGLFSHSTGTSYNDGSGSSKWNYKDYPEMGRDRATNAEYLDGTVQWLSADTVLNIGDGSRMLFGSKNTIIYNFAILRPLARKGADIKLTEQAEKRMAMAGLSFEKISDRGLDNILCIGDTVTYTLTVKNHADNVYKGLELREILPSGVSFVSGSCPFTERDGAIYASFDIGAKETVTISWTLEISDSATAGSSIASETTVGGLKMKTIENTVSAFTRAELALVAEKARAYAESGASFADPMDFVRAVYTEALGYNPFGSATSAEMIASLLNINGSSFRVDEAGAFYPMLAKNLYGGTDLYGTSAYYSNNDLVRTAYLHNVAEGDVIVCEWNGKTRVYIYVGNGDFAHIDSVDLTCSIQRNGSEQWVKSGGNYYQDHLLASLYAYRRFAVLRPAQLNR